MYAFIEAFLCIWSKFIETITYPPLWSFLGEIIALLSIVVAIIIFIGGIAYVVMKLKRRYESWQRMKKKH